MKRSVLRWTALVTVFTMLLLVSVSGIAADRPSMPASSTRLEADARRSLHQRSDVRAHIGRLRVG